MKFRCHGHKNILGTHPTTIEFTKDKGLSLKGNCIIGVNSDFDLKSIKKFINDNLSIKNNQCEKKSLKNKKIKNNLLKVKIIIESNGIKEEINGYLNPDFDNDKEIVIRKSDFVSKRTLVLKADKGAKDLCRDLIKLLRSEKKNISVHML